MGDKMEALLWFLLAGLGFPILAFLIALDEMRGQHPFRRFVYLILVPSLLFSVFWLFLFPFFLVPFTLFVIFMICLGEAFDKPKPIKEEKKIDVLEKFIPNDILREHACMRELIRLTIAICLFIFFLIPFLKPF